jgi:hypothetical protein
MSHRWNCPTRWEAERQGERAYERGEGSWRNPYREEWGRDHCEDAERAWRDGHRNAERHEEERRAEQRQQERRQREQQEQWDYERQQSEAYFDQLEEDDRYYRAMEAAALAEEQAWFADLWYATSVELPRWEDEGGRPI